MLYQSVDDSLSPSLSISFLSSVMHSCMHDIAVQAVVGGALHLSIVIYNVAHRKMGWPGYEAEVFVCQCTKSYMYAVSSLHMI